MARGKDPVGDAVKGAALSWIIPGAGHLLLGHRGLALIFFLAISVPYWVGMALGGILDSTNLRTNQWLTYAAMGVGGYTTPCVLISQSLERHVVEKVGARTLQDALRTPAAFNEVRAPYMAFYPGVDVAQIYIAAAGLMNLLVIIDAASRGLYGEPTFHRELLAAELSEDHASTRGNADASVAAGRRDSAAERG